MNKRKGINEEYELYSDTVLIRKFKGVINVDTIINSWEYLKENNIINPKIQGVITDLTSCDLSINLESFKLLLSYLKKQEFLDGLKLAVITNSPNIITFPFMAQDEKSKFKVKPFSTVSAAVSWINTN